MKRMINQWLAWCGFVTFVYGAIKLNNEALIYDWTIWLKIAVVGALLRWWWKDK